MKKEVEKKDKRAKRKTKKNKKYKKGKKTNEKAEKIAEKDVAYLELRQKPSINPREGTGGQRKEKAKEGLTKNVLTNFKGEPQVPQDPKAVTVA